MVRTASVLLVACFSLTTAALHAQSGKIFDKVYPVGGRPDLHVEVDNSPVHAQSCGACREIHIHVDTRDMNLSDYRLEETQRGNSVHFTLKQRDHDVWHWGSRKGPEVTITLPGEAAVSLLSANGEISAAGFHGDVDLRTDNGALALRDSSGNLHATSDNGRISLQQVSGSVSAKSDNGTIEGDGRLTQLQAETSNGTVRFNMQDGSTLSSGLHVSTGNGAVQLRMPRSLHANVDLRSGNGSVRCGLPVASQEKEEHHLHGVLNGGGAPVQVTTGNGSISVDGV